MKKEIKKTQRSPIVLLVEICGRKPSLTSLSPSVPLTTTDTPGVSVIA